MSKTSIGELNFKVGLEVSFDTASLCVRLIEMYLNNNPDETLMINCNECGNWDLEFISREALRKMECEDVKC